MCTSVQSSGPHLWRVLMYRLGAQCEPCIVHQNGHLTELVWQTALEALDLLYIGDIQGGDVHFGLSMHESVRS